MARWKTKLKNKKIALAALFQRKSSLKSCQVCDQIGVEIGSYDVWFPGESSVNTFS